MADSNIEWTDKVWNTVTGCTKVSQGCKNCYAEGIADRFFATSYPPNADGSLRVFTDVRCHEDRLEQPLRWREKKCEQCNGTGLAGFDQCSGCNGRGKRGLYIFVNSMSDLFHEDVEFTFISHVFQIMRRCPHTFQILTKRAARMLEFARSHPATMQFSKAWLGVSVEDRKTWMERSEILRQIPAAVRMVSYEPALGDLGQIDLSGIGWLICGGESGPNARPMHPDWARSVRDQCVTAGVPFFFKQWGEFSPVKPNDHGPWPGSKVEKWEDSPMLIKYGKKSAGRLLDDREWNEYPTLQTSAR